MHIHPDYLADTGASVVSRRCNLASVYRDCLTEAGVVGVRCAGSAHFMDVAWKRATLAVRGAAGVRLWLFSDHDWRAL